MKQILLLLITTYCLVAASFYDLKISYPTNTDKIISVNKPMYIFGTVNSKAKTIYINGIKAKLSSKGGFIAYMKPTLTTETDTKNYTKIRFDIKISGTSGDENLSKFSWIKLPIKSSSPEILAFDNQFDNTPSMNKIIQLGDVVKVEVKGTPNCKATFTIEGIQGTFNLYERKEINNNYWADCVFGNGFNTISDTVKGIYSGSFILNKNIENAKINVTLSNDKLGTISSELPGKITANPNPILKIVKVKPDPFGNPIIGKNSPSGAYKLFLLPETMLEVVGKEGGWLKCKLTENQHVYVSESSTEPVSTHHYIQKSTPEYIVATENNEELTIKLANEYKIPFQITSYDSPQKIIVDIYNSTDGIDFIRNLTNSDFLKEIKHEQLSDGIVRLEIFLTQKTLWGYKTEFENNVLVLKIKKPLKRNTKNPMNNLTVSIDPGHSADPGAIGAMGLTEQKVNFYISSILKQMLEKSGIKVCMTRDSVLQDVELRKRKKIINDFNPHISVSIHNNSVPENINPLENNGSSVYYYFPQGLPLAKKIQKNLLKNLNLKNFGIFYDNLYMCRIPECISLLVEPAFMTLPEQEELLSTKEFQTKIAKSIYDSIKEFYEEYAE